MHSRKTKQKTEKGENLWNQILAEAMSQDRLGKSNLIVLGNHNSGKRTLVQRLQQIGLQISESHLTEDQKPNLKHNTASASDYTYIIVRDPDDPLDENKEEKMGVWIFDECQHKQLMEMAIQKDRIGKTIVALVLDFEKPWTFENDLTKWMLTISETLGNVMRNVKFDQQNNMTEKIKMHMQKYKEPIVESVEQNEEDFDQKIESFIVEQDKQEEEEQLLPLEQGVLTSNFGIPFFIICTKIDEIQDIARSKNGERKLEYIQYYLRNYALQYGASIIYTSSKKNINIELLYEYIVHRFYDFNFVRSAIPKHYIFIPSGFDSPSLVKEVYSQQDFSEIDYEEIVVPPEEKENYQVKEEVKAQDGDDFLNRLRTKLKEGGSRQSLNSTYIRNKQNSRQTKNFFASLLGKDMGRKSTKKVRGDRDTQKQLREQRYKKRQEMNRTLGDSHQSPKKRKTTRKNNMQNMTKEELLKMIKSKAKK